MKYRGHLETRVSAAGETYEVWSPPVPYIQPNILEGSVFMYDTVNNAETGDNQGGCGFLLGRYSEARPNVVHLYAVTNYHVAREFPVIRIVKMNKQVHIEDRSRDEWIRHADDDDLSICYLGPQADVFYFHNPDWLIRQDDINQPWGVGPGDDCVMIGRYINHEGRQFDRPVLRFGNLSMLPEMVHQRELLRDQESFVVDMRSVAGFSGSVVLVYYQDLGPRGDSVVDRTPAERIEALTTLPVSSIMGKAWILGIDWGHLPVVLDIWDEKAKAKSGTALVHSGMAGVVPAWKIRELLEDKRLVGPMKRAEMRLSEDNPRAAVLDSTKRDRTEFTRSDFDDALSRATRVTPPAESDPEG